MSDTITLDVREVAPRERHPKIFSAWEALPVGGVLRLVNDHDPKPLFYEFKAERAGEFEWTPVERGPERWSVDIARVAPAKKGGPVALEQTVREVSELHPAALEVLMRHGLDTCCGGKHPLAMAAQAHGVDPELLLAELNAAVALSTPAPAERPDWTRAAPDHELDVREDLRAGKEPFGKIVLAVAKVKPGQTLLLRAIFEPHPLYKVLALRGIKEHWAEKVADGDWAVYFRRQA